MFTLDDTKDTPSPVDILVSLQLKEPFSKMFICVAIE
jgi:hypothetical protein